MSALRSLSVSGGNIMGLTRAIAVAAVAVFTSVWMMSVSFAEEPHFKTPEEAITAYISAVKKLDLEAVIATTSVNRMAEHYDFMAQASRLKAMSPFFPAPISSPLFIDINKAIMRSDVARHIQYLAYSLMSDNELSDGKQVFMVESDEPAKTFLAALQANRLAGLSIEKIGIPSPSMQNSQRNQATAVTMAHVYGADTTTERVVLLKFEGLDFLMGIGLLRYGEDWLVWTQTSVFANTSSLGAAKRITPNDFDKLTQ